MKLLDRTVDFNPFVFLNSILLFLIFSFSFTILFGQDGKMAYVNKTTVYQEYNLLQQYHEEFVGELEVADRDINKKVRELDSLYQESVFKSGESATLSSSHERNKEQENESHMAYIRSLQSQYAEKAAQCKATIMEAIEGIVKEAGYTSWEQLESADEIKDGVDITSQVVSKLNQ